MVESSEAAAGTTAGTADAKRIDIISDTHGWLSDSLLAALEGADLIIHAGDITSENDWALLGTVAPMRGVLGNNDGYYNYGSDLPRVNAFTYEGVRFSVSHYREDLPISTSDVAVCGHTHRAVIDQRGRCLVVNPGSATYPRGSRCPTMARLMVKDGEVLSCKIVQLPSRF